jgi:hypothetical protein
MGVKIFSHGLKKQPRLIRLDQRLFLHYETSYHKSQKWEIRWKHTGKYISLGPPLGAKGGIPREGGGPDRAFRGK